MNNCCCCILDAVQMLFCSEKGSLVLPTGNHEVKVTTKNQNPCEVYLNLIDIDSQVCAADINMAGVKLLSDGFVIYANIQSNECKIKWIALFGCDC